MHRRANDDGSSHQNDIHFETYQIRRELRQPILFCFRVPVLGDDFLTFDLAEVVQSQSNCLRLDRIGGWCTRR